LTYGLGTPIGVVGFEGDFALTGDPSEMIEVAVTFTTPPAVALRLLNEVGHPAARFSQNFEATAQEAHSVFQSGLNSLVVPFSLGGALEIWSMHYSLFNGAFMLIPAGMLDQIAALDGVYSVAPAPRFEPMSVTDSPYIPPNDRTTAAQFFMADPMEALQIHETWAILADMGHDQPGYGLRIGVLDTGIDYWHPVFDRSFNEELGRMGGENFIPQFGTVPGQEIGPANPNNIMETLPGVPTFTAFGPTSHGTHVAGTIAAIAPYATLYHYRVLAGSTPNHIIVRGIEAAHRDGMDIVNMSLGGGNNASSLDAGTRAIDIAVLDGIVFVISAGNNNPNQPSLGSPGTAALAITVGAAQRGGINFELENGLTTVGTTPVWSRIDGVAPAFDFEALGEDVSEFFFLGLLGNYTGFVGRNHANFPAFIQTIRDRYLDGNDLEGQVAVFARGFDFTDMRAVAQALNAAAWMVVDNQVPTAANSLENINLATGGLSGENSIPGFIVRQAYLSAFGAQFTGGEISLEGDFQFVLLPDNLSTFSSRGPVNTTQHIKPEIVGPGSDVVSAIPSFLINPALAPGYNAEACCCFCCK
jgi:subtilisin family serine protease